MSLNANARKFTPALNANAQEFIPALNVNAQEFIPSCSYKLSTDERYFENPFKSWDTIKAEKSEIIKKCNGNIETVISVLSPNIDEQFMDYILSFIKYILKQYNPDIVEEYEFRGSVYTGISGFCILFLRIIEIMDEYNSQNNPQENDEDSKEDNDNDNDTEMKTNINNFKSEYETLKWNEFVSKLCKICNVKNNNALRDYLLHCILKYNNSALSDFESRPSQRYSLLEGISGCYAIRIIYYYYMKDDKKINKYIEKLKKLNKDVQRLDSMELLYGRMGYISTYLFIHHFIGNYNNLNILKCNQVLTICQSVIDQGKKYVLNANNISPNNFLQKHNIPLMWEWHESQYFGGAHGVSGIINTLISIPEIFNQNKDILMQMLECCQLFKFKSGNFASSIRGYYKQRDTLVQFCHGSVGFVPMYLTASKMINNNNNKFIKYGIDAQEIIWKRGLLRKGVGLCHGIGGNGYVFLSCYRNEFELQYLYRAMQFASVIVDKNVKFVRKPDRPDSLFEGKCGGVIFVLDVMFAPQSGTFPCYEWC